MEKPMAVDATGGGGGGGTIGRTRSDQLAPSQSLSRTASAETVLSNADTTSLSRKSSFGRKRTASGGGGGGGGNRHIRKSRSAQLKLDVEDLVSSGAALSRASSASLGFSFTFTGFTPPPQGGMHSADPTTFSDDDSRTHD
jgi:hypothetical protein